MLSVVVRPRGVAAGCQRRVEVLWRALFTLACCYEPWEISIDPHGTAPSLDLYLEEHLVINRADPLLRRLVVSEPFACLGQQRMGDLIQRGIDARDGKHEILAQAAHRRAAPPGPHESPSAPPPTESSSTRVNPASIATRDARLPSSSLSNSRIPACITDRKSTRLNSSHLGISYAV